MSGHAGIDRLGYPGDDVMTDLWNNTNLAWTGFYLAHPLATQCELDEQTFLSEESGLGLRADLCRPADAGTG